MESKYHVSAAKLNWTDLGDGIRRKILAYNKSIMMVLVEFRKGAIGYKHKHLHSQVSYVKTGSFEVIIENKSEILEEGDSFLAPSDTEHGVVALKDGQLIDVFSPVREDFLE